MLLWTGGSQRSGPAHSLHIKVHTCAKAEEANKNLSFRIQSGILGFEKEEQETKMPQKAQENLSDLITRQKRYGCWWKTPARPQQLLSLRTPPHIATPAL